MFLFLQTFCRPWTNLIKSRSVGWFQTSEVIEQQYLLYVFDKSCDPSGSTKATVLASTIHTHTNIIYRKRRTRCSIFGASGTNHWLLTACKQVNHLNHLFYVELPSVCLLAVSKYKSDKCGWTLFWRAYWLLNYHTHIWMNRALKITQ